MQRQSDRKSTLEYVDVHTVQQLQKTKINSKENNLTVHFMSLRKYNM